MRGMLLATGLATLLTAQAAVGQTARTPDRAVTMTAIARAESQRSFGAWGSVRLRVPVKLSKMMPEAQRVSVHCSVSGDARRGSSRSAIRTIVNGEFDQVIEVVVTPSAGQTLIGAKSYICRLEIYGPGGAMGNPSQGTPPSGHIHKLARPDAFFRSVAAGSLTGGTVNDGIVGPSGLAVPPRRRQ